MPKFTDTFFLIPVRVYHTELEDLEADDATGDFATAWCRIPCEDFYNGACWYQAYPQGTMGIQTAEKGFELTIIRTANCSYLCTWPMKEFERELNKFMKKMEEMEKSTEEDDLTV